MYKDNDSNRERKNTFLVRLSDDELKVLDKKLAVSGFRNRNELIRHLIIFGGIFKIDLTPLKETEVAVNRIGNNINQIAKKMNETGNVYIQDVREIKKLLDKIYNLISKAFSKTTEL